MYGIAMSQDADTTLSGPDERNPNKPSDLWPELASQLHDQLVGLLTRKPEAAADLAPAIDLAARLRAEGERQWRWLAMHGGAQRDLADTGRALSAAGAGVLDEFAAIARPRMIRETDRFLRAGRIPVVFPAGPQAPTRGTPDMMALASRSAYPEPEVGRRDTSGRRFVVEGRSLHEYSPDADRPPISVSEADYERIARVLARLSRATTGESGESGEAPGAGGADSGGAPTRLPGLVQAKAVREATADAELTAPLEPRLVSLTHVYICLRCWQTIGLVRRQSGGWFMPRTGDRPFDEAALQAWRRLASSGTAVES